MDNGGGLILKAGNLWKENKNQIIISIIVGLFLIFLQQMFGYFATFITELAIGLSTSFSNYFYKLLAQNNPNLISEIIGMGLFYCLCILCAYFVNNVLDNWSEINTIIRKNEASEEKTEEVMNEVGSTPNHAAKEKDVDTLIKELQTYKNELQKKQNRIKKLKKYFTVLAKCYVIALFFVLIYFTFNLIISSEVNRKNTLFQNEVTVLSTRLSDIEIKQLKAEWVKMKSATDFERIENKIREYSSKYNLNN